VSAARTRNLLAAVLLGACGLYLGVRAWSAVQTVQNPAVSAGAAISDEAVAPVEQALALDGALASLIPDGRDPLHPKPRARRPITRSTPKPKPPTPPGLRMVLVDTVSPVIQISVTGALSDRLKVGESFRGWTVDSIAATSAVVSKDELSYTISLRRAQ